jgi:benzil reductase ((S)-benzoin forming)
VYVVTGGGRGLGRSLALALAARGQSVLIIGRHESSLSQVAALSAMIHYHVADVSTPAGRESICLHLKKTPQLKGLIHNAGVIDPIQRLGHIDEAAWLNLMATNVNAPLFLSQALLSQLTHGRVLHIGSGVAHFPVAGWSAYCVSKAALWMLTRCWQLESASPAFTSVMPGILDTDMSAIIRESNQMDTDKLAFFQQLKHNNRLIAADTVALFLCWLLLDIETSDYVKQEWDIYDTSHHASWLPPHHLVPPLE